jgi:hypothetical protein
MFALRLCSPEARLRFFSSGTMTATGAYSRPSEIRSEHSSGEHFGFDVAIVAIASLYDESLIFLEVVL